MDVERIDHLIPRVRAVKGKAEVGAAQHDRLGARLLNHPPARVAEERGARHGRHATAGASPPSPAANKMSSRSRASASSGSSCSSSHAIFTSRRHDARVTTPPLPGVPTPFEVAGARYNIGVKYGLLTAQLALALSGGERAEVLAQMVELLARSKQA